MYVLDESKGQSGAQSSINCPVSPLGGIFFHTPAQIAAETGPFFIIFIISLK